MPLSSIAGVFSRYFIVGFFLPGFFAVFASAWLNPGHWLRPETASQVAIVGGIALLVGLLLVGTRNAIHAVYSGYRAKLVFATARSDAELRGRAQDEFAGIVSRPLRFFQRRRVEKLQREATDATDAERRAKAARLLWSRYGYGRQIRPTRLGNRARVFEDYLLDRYGLTRSCWTRIQGRLDDREQELLVEQDTDQRFFLNTSIGAIGVGAFLASTWAWEAAHGVTHSSEVAGAAASVAVALFISWLAYCAAIGPAESMSTLTCASVDTHVRELYERFGIDAPRTRTDECEAGKAIAAFIDAGTPIPDAMRERDGDTSSGGNGAPVSHASRIALPVVMFAAAVGFAAGSRLRRG
jgi:hypothetical protein